jgi:hypothetical protein
MAHLYSWFLLLRGSMVVSFSIDVKRGRRDLKFSMFSINAKGGVCWSVCTGLGFVINDKIKSIRLREEYAQWLAKRKLWNLGIQKGRISEFRKEAVRSRRERISGIRSECRARPSLDPGEPTHSLK